MSSAIDQIVSVNITRATISVSKASFNIPAIMAAFLPAKTHVPFTRIRAYASLADMVTDGWLTTDDVYLSAAAIFAQPTTVKYLYVGRHDVADTDWTTALNAIQAENDSWYAFSVIPMGSDAASVLTEQLNVAAWTETQKKLYVLETFDANVLSSASTTDAASTIAGHKYTRTAILYRTAGNLGHANLAWVGKMLGGYDVGEATWAYKQLGGIVPDAIPVGQKIVAHGKKANTYCTVSGVDVTETGIVSSGEYIDVMVDVDWLIANLQATVFGAMANQAKVPYDDGGITAVGSLVKSVLSQGASMGILQGDTIVVTLPKYADISTADKQARNLPAVKFTALLQGAIQTVQISGTVSV